MIFHSNLLHLNGPSGQRVRYSEGNTVNTTLTCHNLFCKENCRGWHQSQKYTAEIKMSAVCPIKITGPLTPVMKRNKGDSKVNTIFSLSPEKEKPTRRFCPFAALRLRSAVKETSSGITAWRYIFFLLAITTSCPVSALPVKYWCRGLFCWGVWGSDQRSPADKIALLTLDISDWCQMWPWNPTGVVVLLILLATMSGCLFSVVKRPALLQYKSLYMHCRTTV